MTNANTVQNAKEFHPPQFYIEKVLIQLCLFIFKKICHETKYTVEIYIYLFPWRNLNVSRKLPIYVI